jgi:hypothetical protein
MLEYVKEWVEKNRNWINDEGLKVGHLINRGENKIELGIFNKLNGNGGSFELLKDGTCDIMITDFATSESLYYNTLYLKTETELKDILFDFIKRMKS